MTVASRATAAGGVASRQRGAKRMLPGARPAVSAGTQPRERSCGSQSSGNAEQGGLGCSRLPCRASALSPAARPSRWLASACRSRSVDREMWSKWPLASRTSCQGSPMARCSTSRVGSSGNRCQPGSRPQACCRSACSICACSSGVCASDWPACCSQSGSGACRQIQTRWRLPDESAGAGADGGRVPDPGARIVSACGTESGNQACGGT